MSNLNYKQVANVERRTWDVEAYEKKAADRLKQEAGDDTTTDGAAASENGKALQHEDKPEFQAAAADRAGPEGSERAFLQARQQRVQDLDERVGESTMVSVANASGRGATSIHGGIKAMGLGWHCSVCDCMLKDSHTYLDHINGKKHQRKLGFSMRVERSTDDDLARKLDQLKKKASKPHTELEVDFDKIVRDKDEDERQRKEKRQRKRKERKRLQKAIQPAPQVDDPAESGNEDIGGDFAGMDPAMAAMMGFSGFGGSSKN